MAALGAESVVTPYTDALARISFGDYCRLISPGYIEGAFPRLIVEYLEAVERGEIKRLIIVVPPRHSKSFHASEHFPAWYLSRNPDKRVIAASHTQSLAELFSWNVRKIISDSKSPFRYEHQDQDGQWRDGIRISDTRGKVQEWKLADHDGGYMAVGVGGSPAGRGGDLILIDDPIKNAAVAESQVSRDAIWRWFTRDMYTRRQPNAAIVLMTTRWHEDDLAGRLLAQMREGGETWEVLHFPAIAESNDVLGRAPGDVLWPEFWTEDEYALAKKNIPNDAWLALYQGHPTSATGTIVKREHIRYWQLPGMNLPPVQVKNDEGVVVAEHPVMDLPRWFDFTVQSWDATFKKTTSGSFVVGLTAGVLGASTFLLARFRERASFPETVHAIQSMHAMWPNTRQTYVEAKANGPAIIDTLRPIIPGMVPVETSDGDKGARFVASSWYVEGGNFVVPHPRMPGYAWVDEYVDELVTFPKSAFNDQVDATSQLIARITEGIDSGMDDVISDMTRDLRGSGIGGWR